jgi:hypothetical protein
MATKSAFNKEIPIEALFGNYIAPEKMVLTGMKDLEYELNKVFKTEVETRRQLENNTQILRDSLTSFSGKDDKNAMAIKALKEMDRKESRMKLERPKFLKENQRIFTGSIAATVVPPFSYQWTWNAGSGGPDHLDVSANRSTGRMEFYAHTNPDHSSSGSVRTALGIYFRPVTSNGILRVSANPSINYRWWDYCAFASAHTDGFIGLYIGRYNLSGGFDAAPVNQQRSIWNDSSWWSGGGGSGSNSGFGLSAQLNVDNSHWYALWVWCGGNVSAEGWHTFSGSGAGASMSVAVPSITWELF